MSMVDVEQDVEHIRQRFLQLTGLREVTVQKESAGPETFLRFCVGRRAPLYEHALTKIREELPSGHLYHGRLSLDTSVSSQTTPSHEMELLGTIIERSLRVASNRIDETPLVDFVPFHGGEEQRIIEAVNHVIQGRRGVGKSSLIEMAYRRIESDNNIPIWFDLEPYHGRNDPFAVSEIIKDVVLRIWASPLVAQNELPKDLAAQLEKLTKRTETASREKAENELRRIVPRLREFLMAELSQTKLFLFLDDAHLLGLSLQPLLFDLLHGVLKGGVGYLKVAGVKNLLRVYDPSLRLGLQVPNDAQLLTLDLTLVDPGAAKDHLTRILDSFLTLCGFTRSGTVIPNRAIDRLVWCSAGVPRDFLHLFARSIAFVREHRKERIGVQEVNVAVGEFAQQKLSELEDDTNEDGASLRESMEKLQKCVLDVNHSNSFLVRQDPSKEGYKALQKLVDLRLVHLIHPSITPGKAGERYEAYLLDYSFYTGHRRRRGITELAINTDVAPKYSVLRKLPRIEPDSLVG